MNSGSRFLALAILMCTLIAASPLAAQQRTYTNGKTYTKPADRARTQPAPTQPRIRYRAPNEKPVKSNYNRGLSIAAIRSGAIRQTLVDLERLRPYTINYNALRQDIRRYWQSNITRPTTRGLTSTIMRHVKTFYKGFVRSEVYAGSRAGIAKVKAALKNRRR